MSVKLNRLPKPEESQKDSNFNGKTIPYLGVEPKTSGLAVGSHNNHCTIWVGECLSQNVLVLPEILKNKNFVKGKSDSSLRILEK
jgi:hypothetical protein